MHSICIKLYCGASDGLGLATASALMGEKKEKKDEKSEEETEFEVGALSRPHI